MTQDANLPARHPPHDALLRHWQQAWHDLARPAPQPVFDALIAAWSEPWRHYHTLQHLGECLDALARERAQARHPGEIALALFFHDAVYDLQASDNEARSADWADRALTGAGLPPQAVARVHGLVMATRHQAAPTEPDAQLLVDIDLAILGAPPARFAEYEAQIRREYAHVPPEVFEPRRGRILGGFLARRPLYQTSGLQARCEAQARLNLVQAIAAAGSSH
ncbi:N-methyl-D-aspartate receptor NMDAR2C subunit [Xenophilus sp. Marseille-Q4582]|uniref:HD domain-containing protein n=1 Tax=Xenophilus sp. Marseille-Q4582 TaxID=2866600 RepID=UPI001CE41BEB|nr:N-methyl-D-aspartate receptor NMDAR2C subunit [Xenophilus sp. Marseille-Q4582]